MQCVVGGGDTALPVPKFGNFISNREIEDTKQEAAPDLFPLFPGNEPPQPYIHGHWVQTRSVGVSSTPSCLQK